MTDPKNNMEALAEQVRVDKKFAESNTTCRRRGTLARLVRVNEGDDEQGFASINGSPWCTGEPGNCQCVHAEQRVLIKAGRVWRPARYAMLTTLEPCTHCAALIVEFGGIEFVAYHDSYRQGGAGSRILEASGIRVLKVGGPFR